MTSSISVVVIDHQSIYLEAISKLIADKMGCSVSSFSSTDDCDVQNLQESQVLIYGLKGNGFNAKVFLKHINIQFPSLKVLILVSDVNEINIQQVLNFGVKGIVLRDDPAENIIMALKLILSNKFYLADSGVVSQLCGRNSQSAPFVELSEREQTILLLLAQGCTDQEVATQLHLANQTVRNRLCDLYKKLNVRTRSEAIIWWLDNEKLFDSQ